MSASVTQLIEEVEPHVSRADIHTFPLSSRPEPFFSRVVIRMAMAGDRPGLERLAQLDSSPAPTGQTLIGESQGRPVVAVSLVDGKSIADPFVVSAPILELVRLRAQQLRPESRSARIWPLGGRQHQGGRGH